MTTRRSVLAALGAAGVLPGLAYARALPEPPGRCGWILMDAEDGRIVDSSDARDLFIPASSVKSIVASAAMRSFDAGHRLETRIVGRGGIVDGALTGDLTLVGSGDPTLDSGALDALAEGLRARGVRRLTGRFLADARALPKVSILEPEQPWVAVYNPGLSGLNLNFNRVLMRWRSPRADSTLDSIALADRISVPSRTIRFRAKRDVDRYGYRSVDAAEDWTVPLGFLRTPGQRLFPVRQTAFYAADIFRALCAQRGITLPQAVAMTDADGPVSGTTLARHRSEPMHKMLGGMMRYSTNISAESLGLLAFSASGNRISSLAESGRRAEAMIRSDAGADNDGQTIANLSGLSTTTRLSPLTLARFMRAALQRHGPPFVAMHKERARLDDVGGLSHRVNAKSGTMYFVRAISGFLEMRERRYVFAILTTDDDRRSALDARFTPFDDSKPRGARLWRGQAIAHENALLRGWIRSDGASKRG